jgi:ABC-type xylose transport system permease subunit
LRPLFMLPNSPLRFHLTFITFHQVSLSADRESDNPREHVECPLSGRYNCCCSWSRFSFVCLFVFFLLLRSRGVCLPVLLLALLPSFFLFVFFSRCASAYRVVRREREREGKIENVRQEERKALSLFLVL